MRRRPYKQFWPAWRYGPNGESAIFLNESEVPYGWTKLPGEKFVPPPEPEKLDRSELEKQLLEQGIIPAGNWSARYMKERLEQ